MEASGMKRRHLVSLLGALIAMLSVVATSAASPPRNFVTPMSGAEEVPARDTHGRGAGIFQLSADGQSMSYRLIASNIENVFMAHIHVGPADGTGPIVVWLAPSTTPGVTLPLGGGRHDGVLATGTFTAANFTGPLAGASMDDLVQILASGGAYVNVHTNDGIDPPNTGAGDFPGGEIRGQID
jgi:hypothetical protein